MTIYGRPHQALGYPARGSFARYNRNSWLDIGGALQGVAAASVRICTVACCTQCSPGRFLDSPWCQSYAIAQ